MSSQIEGRLRRLYEEVYEMLEEYKVTVFQRGDPAPGQEDPLGARSCRNHRDRSRKRYQREAGRVCGGKRG